MSTDISIYNTKVISSKHTDNIYGVHPELSISFSEETPVYLLNSIVRTIQSKIVSLSFDFDPEQSKNDVEVDYTNTTLTIDKLEHLVRLLSLLQINLDEDELENMYKSVLENSGKSDVKHEGMSKTETKTEDKKETNTEAKPEQDTYEFVINVDNKDLRYNLTTNDIMVYKNNKHILELTQKFFRTPYILKHLAKNQKLVVNMYPSFGTGNMHSRWVVGDGYYDNTTKEFNVSPKASYSGEYLLYKAIQILSEELDVIDMLSEYGKTLEQTEKSTTPTGTSFRFYYRTHTNEVIGELFAKFCYEYGKKDKKYGFNSCVYLKPHVSESCIQFQVGFKNKTSSMLCMKFMRSCKNELKMLLNKIKLEFVGSNKMFERLLKY